MCGGKGTRLRELAPLEKPLLKLRGETMIERVAYALVKTKMFERIVGVTSPNTPKTHRLLSSRLNGIISLTKAAGKSYSEDLSSVLNNLRPATVFVVSADLPLLSSDVLKYVIARYRSFVTPCTSVIADKKFAVALGIKPSLVIRIKSKEYCHTSISIIDSTVVKDLYYLKEHYIIVNKKELVVNVNTEAELKVAENWLSCT
jgi:GTP:adenosylcobinamide-phosphate guanylyltransferase